MRGVRLSRRGVENSLQDASSDPVRSEKGKWSLAIYAAMPYNLNMVFIETSLFTKLVYNYLTEDEYLGLQSFLLGYPDAGPVVSGSGGVRKLRWAVAGRGKRGGVRVIYYWRRSEGEIWMLTLSSKNETSTIPAYLLKKIATEIEDG